MNIYGSTEIGADVCYAVLSEPLDISAVVRTEVVEGSGIINETDIGRSQADNQFPIYWTEKLGTNNTDVSKNIKRNVNVNIDVDECSSNIINTSTGTFFSDSMEPIEKCENVRDTPTDVQTLRSNLELQTLSHRLIGKSPIGYPIDGNEMYIVRVIKKGKSIDSGEKVNDNPAAKLGVGGHDEEDEITDSKRDSLDEFELLPDGIPGELLVGGSQIALGYHNRPHETNNRFIFRSSIRGLDRCSTSSGFGMKETEDFRKVFRTGDIVVRIPGISPVETSVIARQATNINNSNIDCSKWSGALVWLGRSDLQVRCSRM